MLLDFNKIVVSKSGRQKTKLWSIGQREKRVRLVKGELSISSTVVDNCPDMGCISHDPSEHLTVKFHHFEIYSS